MREKLILLAGAMANIAFLAGCQGILDIPVGLQDTAQRNVMESSEVYSYEITRKDYDTMDTNPIEIDLGSISEDMEGVCTFDGRQLTLCEEGNYVLTGKMGNGSLVINVFDDEVVHLILNNVEISSDNGAAIYVKSADKVIITAKDGTENILSDSSRHDDVQRACIFSNSDLTINGEGMLYVYGYHADGVRSKDRLKLINANVFVRAKEDGIRGNDAVIILDSITEVECEGTGIVSNNDDDMVVVQGGSCKVIAGKNAITSNKQVSIHGSQTDLYSVLETILCNGTVEIDEG